MFEVAKKHLINYEILLANQHAGNIQCSLQCRDTFLSSWQQQIRKTNACFLRKTSNQIIISIVQHNINNQNMFFEKPTKTTPKACKQNIFKLKRLKSVTSIVLTITTMSDEQSSLKCPFYFNHQCRSITKTVIFTVKTIVVRSQFCINYFSQFKQFARYN